MARYLETVAQLKAEVDDFILNYVACDSEQRNAAIQLGHIINLAVRSCPRGVQGTVRKNIVGGAMADHCVVSMDKVPKDNDPTETYNRINIRAIS